MADTVELPDDMVLEDAGLAVEKMRQFFIAQGTERLSALASQSILAAIAHLELARIEFDRANVFRMRGL